MELSANVPTGVLSAVAAAVTEETSQNGIQSLLSQADSLIKNIYPSTSVTNVAALTWPTTVVIGSQTYTITPSSGTTPSTSATKNPSSAIPSTTQDGRPIITSAAPSSSATSGATRDPWDRRLGIILGVVLGSIAVGLLIFLVWFLHRRHKKTGTFFKRRPSSPSDNEVFSWRQPTEAEKYGGSWDAPPLLQPPMATQAPFATRSWTRDDHDVHPAYRNTEYEGPAELSADRSERGSLRRMTTSEDRQYEDRENRPPTPFSPESFTALATSSPVSPVDSEPQRRRSSGFWRPHGSPKGYNNISSPSQIAHQPSLAALAGSVAQDYPHPYYQNPFASSEDYDNDEYDNPHQIQRHLSPTPDIPSRSPRRQSSPRVVYPSEDELGKFDFGIESARNRRPSRE